MKKEILIQVDYKITILECDDSNLTDSMKEELYEWLEYEAIELGLGKHSEAYYDHYESGEEYIMVHFKVEKV